MLIIVIVFIWDVGEDRKESGLFWYCRLYFVFSCNLINIWVVFIGVEWGDIYISE